MSLSVLYRNMAISVYNFIIPPRCNGCSILLASKAIFCEHCHKKIIPVVSIPLTINSKYQVHVFAAGAYQDALKRLILAKLTGHQLAGTHLGTIIWYTTPLATLPMDYIIPIPLHWTRRLSRGFNQTEHMAQALSELSGKPVVSLLKRTKRTAFQTQLSAHDRVSNMKDAFALTIQEHTLYHGKHLILVDDLFTTGTTLTNACKILAQLKPASITCVVGAKVI